MRERRVQRHHPLIDAALDHITRVSNNKARVMVGIAGAPGAGKSTLAGSVAAALAPNAVVVPMDGFHLANAELERLGLADRKGAPETFDEAGFVHLLERIARGDELVYAPTYSRVLHESIGGAIAIAPSTRVIVVEGNYLLLWPRVKALLDLAIYIDVADEQRIPDLIRRHIDTGRDEAAAREWVLRSDEANARLIASSRAHADVVLTRS